MGPVRGARRAGDEQPFRRGESFPVSRPYLSGDPNTDELVALLS